MSVSSKNENVFESRPFLSWQEMLIGTYCILLTDIPISLPSSSASGLFHSLPTFYFLISICKSVYFCFSFRLVLGSQESSSTFKVGHMIFCRYAHKPTPAHTHTHQFFVNLILLFRFFWDCPNVSCISRTPIYSPQNRFRTNKWKTSKLGFMGGGEECDSQRGFVIS